MCESLLLCVRVSVELCGCLCRCVSVMLCVRNMCMTYVFLCFICFSVSFFNVFVGAFCVSLCGGVNLCLCVLVCVCVRCVCLFICVCQCFCVFTSIVFACV